MNITRRHFLRLSAGVGLIASSAYIFKTVLWPSRLMNREIQTFTAYLDTIIPADIAPGAVKLGVPDSLILKSAADKKYRRLIKKGCDWLDSTAKQYSAEGFASLSDVDRQKVVRLASEARSDSLPGIFFKQTRLDAYYFFYANPESWIVAGYNGPPQPFGFQDHSLPQWPNL